MKFKIKAYHPVAVWKWDTSQEDHKLYHYAKSGPSTGYDDDEDEDDDCGICRLAFESCCPECKVPGDDCPLIWGECTHVFHMHCLLKWIDTESSKQQCPMDRRPWVTADRKPDKLPTTVDGAPMARPAPGPMPVREEEEEEVEYFDEDDVMDGGGEAAEEGEEVPEEEYYEEAVEVEE